MMDNKEISHPYVAYRISLSRPNRVKHKNNEENEIKYFQYSKYNEKISFHVLRS